MKPKKKSLLPPLSLNHFGGNFPLSYLFGGTGQLCLGLGPEVSLICKTTLKTGNITRIGFPVRFLLPAGLTMQPDSVGFPLRQGGRGVAAW